MEALKSTLGLGKKGQEGQEPVSGVKGEGTAVEPYDSGNQDSSELGGKAAQETDPSKVTGEAPVDDKAAAAVDSTTSSGKSEDPSTIASAPASAPTPAAATTNESEMSEASNDRGNKPSIGSPGWFKTAIPVGKRKEERQTTAGATDGVSETAGAATDTSSSAQTGLPPNQLGSNVPVTPSLDPSNLDTSATNHSTVPSHTPAATSGATDTSASRDVGGGEEEAAMHDTAPAPTSAHPQSTALHQDAAAAAEKPAEYTSTGGPSHTSEQGSSSGGGLFSNPFSSSDNKIGNEAPLEKRRLSREAYGTNPNAIPTAGGMRVGSVAYERRTSVDVQARRSLDPQRGASLTQSAGPVPEETEEEEEAIQPSASSSKFTEASASDTATATAASPNLPTPGAAETKATGEEAPPRTSMSPSEGKESHKKRSLFGKVKEKLHH